MRLLFVASQLPISRLIRWALESDCSHFAISFDEDRKSGGCVFHNILASGGTLEWFNNFKKTHTAMHTLKFKTQLTLEEEEDIYQDVQDEFAGKSYDKGGFLFWTFAALRKKIFNLAYPKKNLWASSGINLCTEAAGAIKWVRIWAKEQGIDLAMIRPHDLYLKLLATGYFEDA